MEKRDKTLSAIFVALILLLCLIPSVGMAVWGPSQPGPNEVLAQKPELRDEYGINPAVAQDTVRYVEDRFFGRNQLITLGRELSAGVFRSVNAGSVVAGRDGWLYYAETLDDYAGVNGLTDRELYAAARNVALLEEFCRERGMDFAFTLAPNKNSLYPGHMLPALKEGERDAERLFSLLDSMGTEYLDLFELFEGQEETLYFAHDSHWTSRGAALAADAINGALGKESRFFAGDFTQEAHTGDLFAMVYPAARDTEPDIVPTDPPEYTFGSGGTRPDSITINTAGAGEGTLLCYRDSFGNALFPYLAASFGSARFSRAPQYDLLLASELGADTVAVELVERNIGYLLDYPPVLFAPRRQLELPAPTAGEVRVYADNASVSGYATVAAALPAAPDDDSPVYISNGDGVYEAVLTRDGFTALLPATDGPWSLAFYINGVLTAYKAV